MTVPITDLPPRLDPIDPVPTPQHIADALRSMQPGGTEEARHEIAVRVAVRRLRRANPDTWWLDQSPREYALYRRTPVWGAIRSRIMDRDAETCRRCGRKASQVHHRSYAPAVMRGEDDTQLVSLCGSCHRLVEFGPGGGKRSRDDQDAVITRRLEPPDRIAKRRRLISSTGASRV